MSRKAVTTWYETEYIVRPVPDFASQGLMCSIDVADRCKRYVESFSSKKHVLLLLLRRPPRKYRYIGMLDRLYAFRFIRRSGSGEIGKRGTVWRWVRWCRKVVAALCCHT